jgi:hypothetical protein
MWRADLRPQGKLTIKKIPAVVDVGWGWKLKNMLRPNYWRGWLGVEAAKTFSNLTGVTCMYSTLRLVTTPVDGGPKVDHGIVSRRLVTEDFVNYLTDIFQTDETMVGDFKYHAFGVGTTAADAADTNMESEVAYDSRITGGQGEESGTTGNDYESSGTYTSTGTLAITEHSLNNGDTSAGDTIIMMDRHVFAALNLTSGDGVEATYVLTINSGG